MTTPIVGLGLHGRRGIISEELLRREASVIGYRNDSAYLYVKFKAALAAPWVQVHVQSSALHTVWATGTWATDAWASGVWATSSGGGHAYDPDNYISSELVDCRADLVQSVTLPVTSKYYTVFLVPVQYDGVGTKILFDGVGGRPDNLTFFSIGTETSGVWAAGAWA